MQQPTWIGQRLSGRYLIESELGAGGMSAVYKAQDPNLRRVVAIKLIHAHLSKDPEFVRRFEAEAAVVAQLRHPNIVQVYDFNHDGETYYIVFEFVPGETLQGRLKRYQDAGRQMPVKEVMATALGIGRALQYAHEREIAHRDIKPANVMINVHGEAILTDFGIVKIVGGTSHTATGAVMGTARYMSPEQIRGQKVDTRTDIYSYGVMLYEMLGGRAPFSADSAMTLMMMHVNDPVPDIRNLRPGIPAGVVSVVERALAKNPAERYQTMRELLADLERAQSGQPVAAPPRPSAAPDANLTMLDEDAGNPAGSTEVISEYVAPPTGPQQPAVSRTAPLQAAPLGQTAAGASGSGGGGNRALLFGLGGIVLLALILGGVYFVFFRGDGAAISQDGDDVAAVSDDEEATEVPEIPEDEETEPTEEPAEEPTEEPTPVPTEVPPTPEPEEEKLVTTTFENDALGVSFDYPEEWALETEDNGIFLAPSQEEINALLDNGSFLGTVILMVTASTNEVAELYGGVNPANPLSVLQGLEASILENPGDSISVMISEEPMAVEINGQPGAVFGAAIDDSEIGQSFTTQFYVINGPNQSVIIYAFVEDSLEEEVRPIQDDIINSLALSEMEMPVVVEAPTPTLAPTPLPTTAPTAVPTAATTYSARNHLHQHWKGAPTWSIIRDIWLHGGAARDSTSISSSTPYAAGAGGAAGRRPVDGVWGATAVYPAGPGLTGPGTPPSLCVLSANPDHSVIAGSGNCWNLP
jgi:hypothetical protein